MNFLCFASFVFFLAISSGRRFCKDQYGKSFYCDESDVRAECCPTPQFFCC